MASSSEEWRTGVRKEGLPRPCLVPACRHTFVCPSALLAATQAGTGLAGAEERSRRERGDRPASSVWRGGKAEGTGHCALCPEAAQAETWTEPGSQGLGRGLHAPCARSALGPLPQPSPSDRQAAPGPSAPHTPTPAPQRGRLPWPAVRLP